MKKMILFLICSWGLMVSPCLYARDRDNDPGKEIVKIGEDITIEAGEQVLRAVAVGGNVTVDGAVEDDVVAIGGSVFLGPRSLVGGDVVSIGGSIVKQEGAEVRGNLSTIETPDLNSAFSLLSRYHMPEMMPHLFRFSGIMSFIGLLLLGILITALIPEAVGHASAMVEHNVLKSILWGVMGLILIVPVGVVLLISVVGIVLIPVEIIFVICCLILGYIAITQLVGKKLTVAFRRPHQPIMLETIIGMCVLFAVSSLPFLGWLVIAVLACLGFGGVLASIVMRRKKVHVQ